MRASNCLESENIMTVRDLVRRSEDQLLEVRNFGETTLTEVKDKLRELGLHLGMRVPSMAVGAVLIPHDKHQPNIYRQLNLVTSKVRCDHATST